MMSDFLKKRRQKFLTEHYYLKMKQHYSELIDWSLNDSDSYIEAFNTTPVNKQPDWYSIAAYCLEELYLDYTAGKEIETLKPYLYRFIEYTEKIAQAICEYEQNPLIPSVLGSSSEDLLSVIGLAYLLDCRDLLTQIALLADGQRQKRMTITDAMTDRFLKFHHPNQIIRDYDEDYALFSPNHWMICKCIDEWDKKESERILIETLNDNLRIWYKKQKNKIWHNGHLKMEDCFSYFGYWDFEIAALVYLLDLDDSEFHKYLYYPKDLVAWTRHNRPISLYIPAYYELDIVLDEGDIAQVEGYYQDGMSKRIIYLRAGDNVPIYPVNHLGQKERVYVWRKLTSYAISQIAQDKLFQAKIERDLS